jgi:hypothetical protein
VGSRAGLDTETREKSFVSAGDRTPVVQFVVRHNSRLKIILMCRILQCRLDSADAGLGPETGFCEHVSSSVKGAEFLGHLSYYQFIK